MTLTKDIVVASGWNLQHIIFSLCLGLRSTGMVVGANMGGFAQRSLHVSICLGKNFTIFQKQEVFKVFLQKCVLSLKGCEIYGMRDREIRISPLVRAWKVLWNAHRFQLNRWKPSLLKFSTKWHKNEQKLIFYYNFERLWNLNKYRYIEADSATD